MISMKEAVSDNRSGKENSQFKDLTEEESKRGDEKATDIARRLENDDQGGVSGPEGDDAAEDKVETSLVDDW